MLCPPAIQTTCPVAVIAGAVVVTDPPPAAGGLICETNTGLTVVLWPPTIHATMPVAVMPGAVVVTLYPETVTVPLTTADTDSPGTTETI